MKQILKKYFILGKYNVSFKQIITLFQVILIYISQKTIQIVL